MKRFLYLLYGFAAYLAFLVTVLYGIGFTGNLVVSKTIDGIPKVSLPIAIVINISLLLLFVFQHNLVSNPSFKSRLTKFIPLPLERSTFILAASICLMLMMWLWQPMNGRLWTVTSTAGKGFLQFFFFLGWGLILMSTFLVNHFKLFGVHQVWLYYKGKPVEKSSFKTPLFYRLVRHPLYAGFILACWCTPVMTASHLLFSLFCTGYILKAIQFEEKELLSFFFAKIKSPGRAG